MASDESRAVFQRLVDGMAASVRRQMSTERRGEKLRNSALVVLGFLAVWWAFRSVTGLNSAVRKAIDSSQPQATIAEPAGARALSPGIESPETFGQIPSATMLRTRASIDEGMAKAAKARQRQFLYTVEDVVQDLADTEAQRKSFEATVKGLMTDDGGKTIAATQRGVPRFIAIVELERASAARLAQLSELLATIADPVRRAHDDKANYAVPGEEQGRMLAEIKSEAQRAHSRYTNVVEDLASLLRAATTSGAASNGVNYPAPADKPLGRAVEDYRTGLRTVALDDQERRLAEQRRTNHERLMQELLKLEQAKSKAEEDRAQQAALGIAERQREAARIKEAEAARRLLVAKAREPGVRQTLAPFLARSFMQPKEWQGTFLAFERKPEKQPMSLTALRAVGALEPTTNGLGSLACVVADAKDSRPRWAFGHTNTWSDETQQYVASVQALLRELGDVLVEEGMLSK
jgi:hypothetical protein